MTKHCLICQEEAIFKIKDTFDYYCQECAEDNFADLSLLVKVEQEAQQLKKVIREKLDSLEEKDVSNFEDWKN